MGAYTQTPRFFRVRKVNGFPFPYSEDAAREYEAEILGLRFGELRESVYSCEGVVEGYFPGNVWVGGFGSYAPVHTSVSHPSIPAMRMEVDIPNTSIGP